MPNIRLVLWGVLAAILFLNYQTWLHDYEPPVSAVTQQGTAPAASAANTLGDTVPQATTAAPVPAALDPPAGTYSSSRYSGIGANAIASRQHPQ